jgi:hypothetical protein
MKVAMPPAWWRAKHARNEEARRLGQANGLNETVRKRTKPPGMSAAVRNARPGGLRDHFRALAARAAR